MLQFFNLFISILEETKVFITIILEICLWLKAFFDFNFIEVMVISALLKCFMHFSVPSSIEET